jgi:hypothetical protein
MKEERKWLDIYNSSSLNQTHFNYKPVSESSLELKLWSFSQLVLHKTGMLSDWCVTKLECIAFLKYPVKYYSLLEGMINVNEEDRKRKREDENRKRKCEDEDGNVNMTIVKGKKRRHTHTF